MVASKSELMVEIGRADIVYGGDFHALGQAQRTHLKILRALSDDRPVVLALECFSIRAQKWLDFYSRGEIQIDELRVKAKWDRNWGFPWENYRPLLELAKRRGWGLLALNLPDDSIAKTKSRRGGSGRAKKTTRTNPSSGVRDAGERSDLRLRDAKAAEVLHEARARRPDALYYVLFGDLHLAPAHLPREVRKASGRRRPQDLVIHLNPDRVYFQLASQGLELSVDVVKFSRAEFCVLGSPPWVPWQSYLLFLDRAVDADLSRADDDDDFDPTDQVAALIRLAAHDLSVEVSLDQLSVYSSDDNRIWQYLERHLALRERQLARQLLATGRTFYMPKIGVGFLSRSTVNHAAALAGQYLHAKLGGFKRAPWKMPNDFKALIWTEAVAFFISKLVNHKRQSETIADLRANLALSDPSDEGREALRLALDQSLSELLWLRQGRRRKPLVRPRRTTSWFEAARILGGMMGERLYLAHRSRKLGQREIDRLLRLDVGSRSFVTEYDAIVRRIAGVLEQWNQEEADAGTLRLPPAKTRKERL